ncbi:MAG: permease [Bacillota bacterium]|nr:permease [Bacillota bacterium]
MSKFFMLTKVLLKNGGNPFKSSRNKKSSLNILILIIAFIPIIASSTLGLIQSYGIFEKLHLEGAILAGSLVSASMAMIIFGILYVISIYYFVDDTVHLLTMPLRPYAILGAKFILVTIFQYFVEAITFLPVLIAFGVKIGTVTYWIYALIVYITLPVIPNVICSLISIVIMAFGKFFRNKDRIKIVSGMLAIAFAIGINLAMKFLSAGSIESIANSKDLIDKVTMTFPSCRIAASSLLNNTSSEGLIDLIIFILVSAAAVIIFIIIAEGLYLKGVVGLTQSGSSGKQVSSEEIGRHSVKRPQLISFAINEWKALYRTPAYLLNCVFGSVLFPPLMVTIYVISARGHFIAIPANSVILGVATVVCIELSSFNMVSATAVSREGKNFFISRFIPVPFKTQVLGKLIPGLFLSYFSLIVLAVMAIIIFKISPIFVLMVLLTSSLGITASNAFALFVDINFPSLEWDDETKAVKQNLNVGIQMIVTLIIFGLAAFLLVLLNLGLYSGFILLILINGILSIAAYMLLMKKGVKIYSNSLNYFVNTVSKKWIKRKKH